jgi:hypothetical protein
MKNKYPGTCINCKSKVEAGAGEARKSKRGRWYVLCGECTGSRSHVFRMNSGAEVLVNVNGRCIDAPCCGCCS